MAARYPDDDGRGRGRGVRGRALGGLIDGKGRRRRDPEEGDEIFGREGNFMDAPLTMTDLHFVPNSEKYKIVMLGAEKTGKSAFLRQFCHNDFRPEEYRPTVKERKTLARNFELDHTKVDLELYDFSPLHRDYTQVLVSHIHKGHGFIVCFDKTDRQTYEEIDSFVTLIEENRPVEDLPIALAAVTMPGGECKVQPKEVKKWVKYWNEEKNGMCQAFDWSAVGGEGLDDIMTFVVRGVRSYFNMLPPGADPVKIARSRKKSLTDVIKCLKPPSGLLSRSRTPSPNPP